MIPLPEIRYYIPGVTGEIRPDSRLWASALSEPAFDLPGREAKTAKIFTPPITIGEYFLAARLFLFKDDCRMLGSAFQEQTGKPLDCGAAVISLSLEKHGVFYHPVKVLIKNHDDPLCALVLNGAVSVPGLELIEAEHRLLSAISGQVPLPVFPRVYGQGSVGNAKGAIGFFVGEWFEGFNEFHVSMRNQERAIVVWGDHGENRWFTLDEAAPIYEDISFVLTSAYNLETGEQIFPWHHAAGDFIVNPDLIIDPSNAGLAVRLITVRGYGVLAAFDGDGENRGVSMLAGLLVFFLNLSLRMQLDKIDGIGETVFLGEAVLRATLSGFFKGLDGKEKAGYEDLKQAFLEFLNSFTPEQLVLILENVLEARNNKAQESVLIKKNLNTHCLLLHGLLKTGPVQDFY